MDFQFAQVTSNIIEAVVSIKRLSSFLNANELQPDARTFEPVEKLRKGDTVVTIKNGTFTWSSKSVSPTLEDIELTVRKGELVGVMGKVGAGKVNTSRTFRMKKNWMLISVNSRVYSLQ